jgi:hypothetical protein
MITLAGCNLPQNATATDLPGSPTTTSTTTPADKEPVTKTQLVTAIPPTSSAGDTGSLKGRALIHIKTTSDWSNLRLVSGAKWGDPANLKYSLEAGTAKMDGDIIKLSQSTARSQAGQAVEMSLDVSFSNMSEGGQVVFEIQRGFSGATQVELSTYNDGQAELINTFVWDKINKDNGNNQQFTIPASALHLPRPAIKLNDFIVIAQLNLWYFGDGCHGGFEDFVRCSGRRTTPFEPALGHTYTSSNAHVIQQQIDWAADNGVDAFSLEWTTPRGVGTSGSMEDNIDDAFLRAPNLSRIRWCIFYDTILRITQDPAVNADFSNGVNFDDPKIYKAFVSDFDHFATKYFGQAQYLKVDGRPVIYIYAAWNFKGNYAGAIKEARAMALAQGYDVFIAGDALRADNFNARLASQFDANTTFTFLIPGLPTYADMGQTAPAIDRFFQKWRRNIQGLTVAGRKSTVNFEPAWAPQFDNRLFEPGNSIYVPAQSKEQVSAMAQVARDNAEPVGSQNQKLIWLNTWNNWAEATTVEPTANLGPGYPAGNYQFDMLDVVRETFGAQTFGSH